MSKVSGEVVSVKIVPAGPKAPAGKLADVELIFESGAGPLNGLMLVGSAVWERRNGGRNVTFPARSFVQDGTRRSFALLRPANGEPGAQDAIRQCILEAYARLEAHS